MSTATISIPGQTTARHGASRIRGRMSKLQSGSSDPNNWGQSLSNAIPVLNKIAKQLKLQDKGWQMGNLKATDEKQAGWAVSKGTYRSVEDIRETLPPGIYTCLLYTSDAAHDLLCVDLGG